MLFCILRHNCYTLEELKDNNTFAYGLGRVLINVFVNNKYNNNNENLNWY